MPSIATLKYVAETYSLNGLLRQQFDQKYDRLKRERLTRLMEFKREFNTHDPSPLDFEARVSSEAQQLLAERSRLLKNIERTENFPTRLKKFEEELEQLRKSTLKNEDRNTLRAISKSLNDLPKNIYDTVILPLTGPLKEKHAIPRHLQVNDKKRRILYRRDLYFLLYAYFSSLGPISSGKGHIYFFDEGQNISRTDYYLIFKLAPMASFNILGDTKQCLYSQLGIASWGSLQKENIPIYTLQKNYRNTKQIVDFINQKLKMNMIPLGLNDGSVQEIVLSSLATILSTLDFSKAAIIVASAAEYTALVQSLKHHASKLYYVKEGASAAPSNQIPVYPVAAVRGLEFNTVFVYEKNMSTSMRYVAYSRSLQHLYLMH